MRQDISPSPTMTSAADAANAAVEDVPMTSATTTAAAASDAAREVPGDGGAPTRVTGAASEVAHEASSAPTIAEAGAAIGGASRDEPVHEEPSAGEVVERVGDNEGGGLEARLTLKR